MDTAESTPDRPRRPLRLLLAGFGNVGRRLAEILVDPAPYPGLAGLDVRVVAVTTGAQGALANPAGIDLAAALALPRAAGGLAGHTDAAPGLTTAAAVRDLDFDVLVELSPLTVTERGEPAIGRVRAALERGRHVVSANKGPVAWAYRELSELAAEQGVRFLFESAVMDGVPVFSLARRCLRGARVRRVEGILNSTTNVILCAMENGASFEGALALAQRQGVAEADPYLDLSGWDAAVKLAALATVLLDAPLAPEQVERESLSRLTGERLAAVRRRGRRLKMVAEAVVEGGRAAGRVSAREVELDDPFALVEGTSSILRLDTDILGCLVLTEEAPDLTTTAAGVLGDLLEIAESS